MDSCLQAVVCVGLAGRAQRFVGCGSAIPATFLTCPHIQGFRAQGSGSQQRKAQGSPHIAENEESLSRDARREGYTTQSQRKEAGV